MGCGPSKKEFLAVQEATGMSKKEASESFKQFKKEAGATKVKLDKFTKLVATMNTNKGKEHDSEEKSLVVADIGLISKVHLRCINRRKMLRVDFCT